MSTPTSRTPFDERSTAAEVLAGVDLHGRRAVITGGSSGLGRETARALANAGADVTLAVRNIHAGNDAATAIAAETGNPQVHVAHLDLNDRTSIHTFARVWTGPLHILVNNAGIMALPELDRTDEGWERQFAVNHLGSAELALELRSALAEAPAARVVQVASSAHMFSPVVFDDLHFETRPYEAWSAYGQSKTAMILFTVALAHHWEDIGLAVNTLHPGGIMTNLQRHLDDQQLSYVGAKDADGNTLTVPPGWKTVEQGAATSAFLAGSPLAEGVTGRYFEDVNVAPGQSNPAPGAKGVAEYAVDPDLAERLFDATLSLLAR